MQKSAKSSRDTDREASGIPNRTGRGSDPAPTPPRGEAKRSRRQMGPDAKTKPGRHAERPHGDRAP